MGGLIRHSANPFFCPILLVRKKDGSWRFYVDYRELNKAPGRAPRCHIQQTGPHEGYHQIQARLEDVAKTAFRTHNGHNKFLDMPFGLTNTPATFLASMKDIFRSVLHRHIFL